MNTNGKFDCALRSLDQVIGDALHREACMWMDEDGKRCQNIVSKSSRVDGAVCLQAMQDLSLSYSTAQRLAVVRKFFLCSECRHHRFRPGKCDQHSMCQSNRRGGQTESLATPTLSSHTEALQQRQGHISQPFRIDTSAWLRLTSPTR